MLQALLPQDIFAVFLVFTRIGSALMVLPGFGDVYVPPRQRLLLALLIAVLVTPVLRAALPALPDQMPVLALLLTSEIVVGLFIGTVARMFMASLTTAGMMIAYMSGMANALIEDPTASQQGAIAGTFLTLVALLMVMTLDLHHLMLRALIDSYELFRPGSPLPAGDFSDMIARLTAETFAMAFRLATPFIVVGTIFYLGIGLLSRLMPQVQIFFVAMPLQIMLGMTILFLTLPVAIGWFVTQFRTTLGGFIAP